MKTLIKYTVGVPIIALFLGFKYTFKRSEWDAGDATKLVLCMALSVGYMVLGIFVGDACGFDLNTLR